MNDISRTTGRFAGSCTVELTTQQQPYDNSKGVLELLSIWAAMLDAIRRLCDANIVVYRALDVHGTYYYHIYRVLMDYSWITRALLTCTACTFSVSNRGFPLRLPCI